MNQGDLKYCIPSYKRCNRQKAVNYLLDIGCDKNRIVISTQTREDYEQYKLAHGSSVGEILFREGDRVSTNRNTILEHFKPGERIVLLEDDLNKVVKLTTDIRGGAEAATACRHNRRTRRDCCTRIQNCQKAQDNLLRT